MFQFMVSVFTGYPMSQPHILNVILTSTAWVTVSFFLAERASQRRGHMIVWYVIFLIFNVWGYLFFLFIEARVLKIRAEKHADDKKHRPGTGISNLVSSAVHVYDPRELKEQYIQDLVEQNRFDDAIQLTKNRVGYFEEEGDGENAEKYRSMIHWLQGAKDRYIEEQEES